MTDWITVRDDDYEFTINMSLVQFFVVDSGQHITFTFGEGHVLSLADESGSIRSAIRDINISS